MSRRCCQGAPERSNRRSHDGYLPAPSVVLLTALRRLARQRATNHVQAEITRLVRVGETVKLGVTIRIDPRWYINAHRPLQERLSPTRIEVEGAQHQ